MSHQLTTPRPAENQTRGVAGGVLVAQPPNSRRALQSVCTADITGAKSGPPDGRVDIEDLLALLAAFGQTGPRALKADIVQTKGSKNVVNIEDLLALLAQFGTTCKTSPTPPPTPPPR
eukprot:COSAG01_NODE_1977_length_8749_cov_2.820809_2_plen_118_part_00